MRIARVLTRLNLGGPVRQVLASDPLLLERGHQVRILTGVAEPGEGDLFDELTARGLDVVRIAGLGRGIAPLRDLGARRRIRAELERFAPDVVHTHASKAGLLGRWAAGRPLGGRRVARVHTFHGHVLEGYFRPALSRLLVALERRLAASTDRVVAVSHATAEDLLRLGVVSEEKLVVIQPGIELDTLLALERSAADARAPGPLRQELGLADEDVLVGVVGRLAEVKRPELAVEVFETLAARYPRLVLVFIGDGAGREALEERIARVPSPSTGERPRIHLAGAREHMAPLLADLDAVLLVSRSEGMPVSLIEAAAAGLPVLATPVGGVPELVVHERTGFLGSTTAELAFGLQQLLDRPAERRAMGERARLRVGERHSARSLADRLEALYLSLVPGGKRVTTELSIVIPSWNTRELLAACLSTLRDAPKPDCEIIVVENGSEDGSGAMVAESFPEVQLIVNEKNEGFARGSNQGMRAATGRYVLLLNSDTEIHTDALVQLHAFLEANSEYGAVAPRLVHPDGKTQPTVQAFPTLWTPLFFATPLERWFPNSRELKRYFLRGWPQENSADVDQPPAACLMIRREVLDQIGLFDEELWLFFNDVDLSRRMRAAGWRTRYLAEAQVVHHVGASTSKFGSFVPEWQRNRLAYYRKHHGRMAGWWLKACATLAFVDWCAQQTLARLRGRGGEPLGPTAREYRKFVAS